MRNEESDNDSSQDQPEHLVRVRTGPGSSDGGRITEAASEEEADVTLTNVLTERTQRKKANTTLSLFFEHLNLSPAVRPVTQTESKKNNVKSKVSKTDLQLSSSQSEEEPLTTQSVENTGNMQISPNSQKFQRTQSTENSQGSQSTENTENTENPQEARNTQRAQSTENPLGTENTENPQGDDGEDDGPQGEGHSGYSFQRIRAFLRNSKGQRAVKVEDFFPDLQLFMDSVRFFMKNAGGLEPSFIDQEVFRLKKLLLKVRVQLASDD
ncbi:uncharacterized protein V6R79_006715 [Siganus canaliculatus]